MTMAERPANPAAQPDGLAAGRRIEPGIRRGSHAKSSSVRTSTSAGHFGVPMRRVSFSAEIALIDDMARPFKRAGRDASAVASWGDRIPHGGITMPAGKECQAAHARAAAKFHQQGGIESGKEKPRR